MSLSTCYSEFDRHVARLRRRRRRRAYAPTSNTASHDNHEKINSWFSFVSHIWVAYGAPPGGPFGQPELRYNKYVKNIIVLQITECQIARIYYLHGKLETSLTRNDNHKPLYGRSQFGHWLCCLVSSLFLLFSSRYSLTLTSNLEFLERLNVRLHASELIKITLTLSRTNPAV